MNVTCPACGADMSLDVLLAHEESRRALARLVALGVPLGALLMRYLALFRPAKRQLQHGRVVTLLEELLPDVERGHIERKGRLWAAPREAWRQAIETVLEARDKGAITLPLKSHGYLYEVIASQADKAEAQGEQQAEAERRARAHAGGVLSVGQALAAVDERTPASPPAPTRPSYAARQMQARLRKPADDTPSGDAQ